MVVALSYDYLSQDQAARLADWLVRLGPFHNHSLIVAVESRVSRFIADDLRPFFADVEQIEFVDPYEHYPESKNLAFQQAAGWVASKYLGRVRIWLYLEPDIVPTRGTFLDEIEAEAMAGGKPFTGAHVEASTKFRTPAHMAAVGVYPVDMIRAGAGDAMNAHETPFPAAIASTTTRLMHISQLICHDLEGDRGLGECALYHPDRNGKILENLSAVPVLAEPCDRNHESGPTGRAQESTNVKVPGTIGPDDSYGGGQSTLAGGVEAVASQSKDRHAGEAITATETGSRRSGVSSGSSAPPCQNNQSISPDEMKELIERVLEEKLSARDSVVDENGKFRHGLGDTTRSSIKPWENKLETQERIKELVLELSTYCSRPAYSIYVRKRLHEAKLIYYPRKYKSRNPRKGPHWKQIKQQEKAQQQIV